MRRDPEEHATHYVFCSSECSQKSFPKDWAKGHVGLELRRDHGSASGYRFTPNGDIVLVADDYDVLLPQVFKLSDFRTCTFDGRRGIEEIRDKLEEMGNRLEQFLQAQQNEKDRLPPHTKSSSVASRERHLRSVDNLQECARSVRDFVSQASIELNSQLGSSQSSDTLSRAGSHRSQSPAVLNWLRTLDSAGNFVYDRHLSRNRRRSQPEAIPEEGNEEGRQYQTNGGSRIPHSTSRTPTNRGPSSQSGFSFVRSRPRASESGESNRGSFAGFHAPSGRFSTAPSDAGHTTTDRGRREEEDIFDKTNQLPDGIHHTAEPSLGPELEGAADLNDAYGNHVQEPSLHDNPEAPPDEADDIPDPDTGIVDDEDRSVARPDTTIPERDENAPEANIDEDLEPDVRLKEVQSQVIQHQFQAAKTVELATELRLSSPIPKPRF